MSRAGKSAKRPAGEYVAADITVLEGLEPVRRRPGMYIGGTDIRGLHHLVWEILDNSVDEAQNGHCTKIEIVLEKDGAVTIADNGRGIPVDIHPKTKKSALETILTTLHAGGKFEEGAYHASGGLHGVGASVVCALSESLTATVWRDGKEYRQSFARGKAAGPVKTVGPARRRGTQISFKPDPQIFPKTHFHWKTILDQAEAKAFLNKGLSIVCENREAGEKQAFLFAEGLKDYLDRLTRGQEPVSAIPFYIDREEPVKAEIALAWTPSTDTRFHTYVNSIATVDGGSHEQAVRAGLTAAVRGFMEKKNLLPKTVGTLTADDVTEGMVGALALRIANPEFQGQTKEKLNNADIVAPLTSLAKHSFETFLYENPSAAEAISNRIILAAQARVASRLAKEAVRKTGASSRLALPGKLADCTTTDVESSELFIVEGDSAGGSAKMARDRKTQAVLALRGKILNVEQVASLEKIRGNAEVGNLISALGCGIGPAFDYQRLRYRRIILMTDADVDGAHISVLLLTLLYRHLPDLIRRGHVYLAMPPLYRIERGKKVEYAMDDAEKDRILARTGGNGATVSRFKGLGEMNAEILKETTMDRRTRTLLKVRIEDPVATDQAFETLMGKDVKARFQFIKERAEFVKDLDT